MFSKKNHKNNHALLHLCYRLAIKTVYLFLTTSKIGENKFLLIYLELFLLCPDAEHPILYQVPTNISFKTFTAMLIMMNCIHSWYETYTLQIKILCTNKIILRMCYVILIYSYSCAVQSQITS